MLVLVDEVSGEITARSATPWEWISAHLLASKLDRALAKGACPDGSAQLALRAQALVRVSTRQLLAQCVQQVLADATRPNPRRRVVPVCCQRVLDSSADFQQLIRRLLSPAPLPAAGVAQVRVLLTDGAGPLYYRGSPEDLGAKVHRAVQALEPFSNW